MDDEETLHGTYTETVFDHTYTYEYWINDQEVTVDNPEWEWSASFPLGVFKQMVSDFTKEKG